MHKAINEEQLYQMIKGMEIGEQLDCFITLNGFLRSSKTFIKGESGFTVVNEIDGSTEEHPSLGELLHSRVSNIGEAVRKGAFFLYDYELERMGKMI